MSTDRPERTVEEANLEKILVASTPWPPADFEERLAKAVLAEVASRRHRRAAVRRFVRPLAAVAAAACLVAAFFIYQAVAAPSAEVSRIYGIVTVTDGGAAHKVAGRMALRGDYDVFTEWGSRAEITLADTSTLRTMPDTRVRVKQTDAGARVALEEGGIDINAAKQPAGKWLGIETAAAQVKVLGTVLQVRAAAFAGRKRTRVTVDFGSVEVSAAGQSVTIAPNMEAVIDEGKPPVAQFIIPEIPELARLQYVTGTVVAKGVVAGPPAIVDFETAGSSTVWFPYAVGNAGASALAGVTLSPRRPFGSAEAYTQTCDRLPVEYVPGGVKIDLSVTPVAPGKSTLIFVKLKGVQGLFSQDKTPGEMQFDAKAASAATSLVEFRLPSFARIKEVTPDPVERGFIESRNIFVVKAGRESLDLFDAR